MLVFVIVADLIFIAGTWFWYSEDTNKIWEYVRVRQYADKIEEMYPGKIAVYYTAPDRIFLKISPDTTLDDCIVIASKFQNWRLHDSALNDFTTILMFPEDVFIGCTCGLDLRTVISFAYDENGGDKVEIRISSGEIASSMGSKLPPFDGSKLSSFGVFGDTLSISTGVYIEFDDESVLSNITEWDCPPGLYTEEQLADLAARGIPVTVWGEEDAA